MCLCVAHLVNLQCVSFSRCGNTCTCNYFLLVMCYANMCQTSNSSQDDNIYAHWFELNLYFMKRKFYFCSKNEYFKLHQKMSCGWLMYNLRILFVAFFLNYTRIVSATELKLHQNMSWVTFVWIACIFFFFYILY